MQDWDFAPRKKRENTVAAVILVWVIIAVIVAAIALAASLQGAPRFPGTRTRHNIDVTFSDRGDTARVRQAIAYNNATGGDLGEIWLYLYPNAFADEEGAPFPADEMSLAYPEGFSPGGVSDLTVVLGGTALDLKPEGPGFTHLRVPMIRPLAPEATIEIILEYTLAIPRCDGRYGYSENEIRLCNAFAIPAAHMNGEWLLYPYDDIGEAFVSEVADYAVAVHADAGWQLAATGYSGQGETQRDAGQDSSMDSSFEAVCVRDLAVVLTKRPVMLSASLGDTQMSIYCDNEAVADQAMRYARDVISLYANLYGAYPYDALTIVASDFYIGGMEYPGLVLIDQEIFADEPMLEFLIAHEVAHQWWYSVVGSDSRQHPWLDETLASHSTLTYYWNRYDRQTYEDFIEAYVMPGAMYTYYYLQDLPAVGAPTTAFYDGYEYSAVVYDYGALLFEQLREDIGTKALDRALAAYYERNRFGIARPEDLLQALTDEVGKEASDRLRSWVLYRRDPWNEDLSEYDQAA